jgi:hypothetical protein
MVESDSLSGLPTNQTMAAIRNARPRLKAGPAAATMILSSGLTAGS